MHIYSFEFKVVGEIADMLHLEQPDKKLLVDVSSDLPGHEEVTLKKYPSRTTLTIVDAVLIEYILTNVSIGDVIEAAGTFTQTNYVPYRTTCIDTTFLTSTLNIIEKSVGAKSRYDALFTDFSQRSIH